MRGLLREKSVLESVCVRVYVRVHEKGCVRYSLRSLSTPLRKHLVAAPRHTLWISTSAEKDSFALYHSAFSRMRPRARRTLPGGSTRDRVKLGLS